MSNAGSSTVRLPSLEAFLVGAKQSLRNAIGSEKRITLVIGRDTADLDSIASAIVFAYLRSAQPPKGAWTPLYIPIVNAKRSVTLAQSTTVPRILHNIGLSPDQLIYLDDLVPQGRRGSGLVEETTRFFLVDHNVMPGLLNHSRYVIGCIDHHLDEHYVAEDTSPEPRIIGRAGSCTSLVVYYGRKSWAVLDSRDRQGWEAQLGKLALAAILADTQDLEARSLLSEEDVVAAWFLESKIATFEESFNRHNFYKEIMGAEAYTRPQQSSTSSTAADSGIADSTYVDRDLPNDSNAPMGNVSVLDQNILSRNNTVKGKPFQESRDSVRAGKTRAVNNDDDPSDRAMAAVRANTRAEEARSAQVRRQYMPASHERQEYTADPSEDNEISPPAVNQQGLQGRQRREPGSADQEGLARDRIAQEQHEQQRIQSQRKEQEIRELEQTKYREEQLLSQRAQEQRQRHEQQDRENMERQRVEQDRLANERAQFEAQEREREQRVRNEREQQEKQQKEQAQMAESQRMAEAQEAAEAERATEAQRRAGARAEEMRHQEAQAMQARQRDIGTSTIDPSMQQSDARHEEARIIALRAMTAPTVPLDSQPSQPSVPQNIQPQREMQDSEGTSQQMQPRSSWSDGAVARAAITRTIGSQKRQGHVFTSGPEMSNALDNVNSTSLANSSQNLTPRLSVSQSSKAQARRSGSIRSKDSRKSSAQYIDSRTLRVEATDPRAREVEQGFGQGYQRSSGTPDLDVRGASVSSSTYSAPSTSAAPNQSVVTAAQRPFSFNNGPDGPQYSTQNQAISTSQGTNSNSNGASEPTNYSNPRMNGSSSANLGVNGVNHIASSNSINLYEVLLQLYTQRTINENLIGITHTSMSLTQLISLADNDPSNRPQTPGTDGIRPQARGTGFTAAMKRFAMERRLSLYAIATTFESSEVHPSARNNHDVDEFADGEENSGTQNTSGRQLQRELLLWVFTPQLAFFIPIFTLVKGAELGLEPWRRVDSSGALSGSLGSRRGKEKMGDNSGGSGGMNGGNGGANINDYASGGTVPSGSGSDEFRGVGEGIIRAFWQRNVHVGGQELERLLFEGLELVK